MAGKSEFADTEVKKLRPVTSYELKKLTENPSNTFFENREYKSSSEKCRSHQTLSFKRNLLDLEFNAAQGDSSTKKCTEDLIDLFERKSNASNALQAASDTPDTPRKRENVVPEQKEVLIGKKSKLATILAETQDDLPASVDSVAEDIHKVDVFSFYFERAEGLIGKAEPPLAIDDKFSENDDIRSELVDIDSVEAITDKRESISDKLDANHSLLTDTISTEGDVIPHQALVAIDIDTTDNEEASYMNRIKVLKRSMDEINSMIAIEKDLLRQEKLELENSQSIVPFGSSRGLGSADNFGMAIQDPIKVLEGMKLKERRLKISFQMKQIAEAEKKFSSELQLISTTASKVDQLNQDMAEFSLDELSYLTFKDNNYSISQQSVISPKLQSPINSPRLSLGSDRKRHGSILSSRVNDFNTTPFDGSLMSPIEFTMGDTRLQMQAADHFKLKISEFEAQLKSSSSQPWPKTFSGRSSGRVSPPPNFNTEPMKALT